jgi:hypothetical protein
MLWVREANIKTIDCQFCRGKARKPTSFAWSVVSASLAIHIPQHCFPDRVKVPWSL